MGTLMSSMLCFGGLLKTQNRSNKLRLRREERNEVLLKSVSGEVQRASFQQTQGEAVIQPGMPGMLLALVLSL